MFGLILTLALFSTSHSVKPPAPQPLAQKKQDAQLPTIKEGYYTAVSDLPVGKKVKTIVIIRKARDVYIFTQIQRDGSSLIGVGTITDGKFVIGWGAGDAKGVTYYNLSPDGKQLQGAYAVLPGDGKLHAETLTFLTDLGAEEEEPHPKD